MIPNFAIIGNCRLGNGQSRHSLEDPGSGVRSISKRTTYHGTVNGRETPVQGPCFAWSIMVNRPDPPGLTKSPFTTCLLLPRSSTDQVYFCPFRELQDLESFRSSCSICVIFSRILVVHGTLCMFGISSRDNKCKRI